MAIEYVNVAMATVTESAANTLTYQKLDFGIGLLEKKGILIQRLEWLSLFLDAGTMNGDGDYIKLGVAINNTLTNAQLLFSEPAVVDSCIVFQTLFTAVGSSQQLLPIKRNFSDLAGGGLLVPAAPMFIFACGNGLVAASTWRCRMYYTLIDLKAEDYIQLVEARRLISG